MRTGPVHVAVDKLQSSSCSAAIGSPGPTSRAWEAQAAEMQSVPAPYKIAFPMKK